MGPWCQPCVRSLQAVESRISFFLVPSCSVPRASGLHLFPELLFISKRTLEAPVESIFKDHFHTSRGGDSESHGGGMEGLPGFT